MGSENEVDLEKQWESKMKLILVNNNGGKPNEDDLGENQKGAKSTVKKVYIKVLEILRFCSFDLVAHGKLEWTGG